MTDRLTIRRPDDWHLHLRDGAMLGLVAPYSAAHFARAIVMPNLVPPITRVADALAYRARILAALPEDADFAPLMTCYLTDDSDPDEVLRGFAEGAWAACKLYPAHATTNAAHGVTDLRRIRGVLAAMERVGMPLLIHGEVTDRAVDIFDREAVFVERVLTPLLAEMPGLKVVLEHVTTEEATAFVAQADATIAATITPQHLLFDRNALFDGALRPHAYCLPVLKRARHRAAVVRAAVSGSGRFFAGTDSAPHGRARKEAACGCAGIFNAPHALACYAELFEAEGALDRLEGFVAEHGARFYGMPLNTGTVTLERVATRVPDLIGTGDEAVVPFRAGGTLAWRVAEDRG